MDCNSWAGAPALSKAIAWQQPAAGTSRTCDGAIVGSLGFVNKGISVQSDAGWMLPDIALQTDETGIQAPS